MLRRLLKYDLYYNWRLWRIIAPVAFLMALGAGGSFRMLRISGEGDTFILNALGWFGLVFCVLAVIAFYGLGCLMPHYRFFKNFFTDEGYLSFTLPVSRAKLLASKTLNTGIWSLLSTVVVGLCFLAMLLMWDVEVFAAVFSWLGSAFVFAWEICGVWTVVYALELILILLANLWLSIALSQLCITIGAIIAKKHKLFAGLGAYYLGNMALSFLFQFIGIIGLISAGGAVWALLENVGQNEMHFFFSLVLFLFLIIPLTVAALMHFITLGRLEHRLNLA